MTQLSDAYDVSVVEAIRTLTAGITDIPTLPPDQWDALVRRAAAVDADIARIVQRVDRRASLQGLAGRYAGEAARSDQHPGLREVVDRLVQGNGKAPTAEEIDKAVDEAASWSYRTRQRAQVVRVAVDQLPSRLGISDRRWASHDGPSKHPDSCGMVPVAPFETWCRHAAAQGDTDALIQMAFADGIALDNGKYANADPRSTLCHVHRPDGRFQQQKKGR